MYDKLKERIKIHEGFRNYCYKDSLGKLTVGYGHLCKPQEAWEEGQEYDIEMLEQYFEQDFSFAVAGAESLIGNVEIPQEGKEVIIEMVFQLGKMGVSKFSKMWKAIDKQDYEEAANQMLDSRWHKQTKSRAESLATIMRSLA